MNFPALILALLASALPSIAAEESDSTRPVRNMPIVAVGSDSMLQLMFACSEAYAEQTKNIVEVSGGGSGIGIAALAKGTADIALSARKMTPAEVAAVKKRTGREPIETVIAYETLAIIVAKESKLASVSIEELREIFSEGGKMDRWEQIDGSGLSGQIECVVRHPNSGEHVFFNDTVLGAKTDPNRREPRSTAKAFAGSKEAVDFTATRPNSIGYVRASFVEGGVKALPLAVKKGGEGFAPTVENIRKLRYPLAREFYVYTAAPQPDALLEFLTWLKGKEGQRQVKRAGYVTIAD